ncbi:MAG: DUF4860 domain-containing protein [Syntrophomonadaceae bacterium]|jgi:hypothetical protein|nr:DUF4860 domain-containing protein [Syntrophomonadaceae bacterium]
MKYSVKNEKGYSLIEIAFVMILISLFGLTTYTLVAVGAKSYETMLYEREDHSNLRVALSYISTRVRQADVENDIRLEKIDGSSDALVISSAVDDDVYETWIYQYDSHLYELFKPQEIDFDPAYGTSLVAIGGMDLSLSQDRQGINIKVWNIANSQLPALNTFIKFRTV